jgi:hypothetical protein
VYGQLEMAVPETNDQRPELNNEYENGKDKDRE